MKRKFFTTLALFVSLALTACGGGKGNGGDAEWKSDKTNHWHIVDGEEADKAKHEFEEDKSLSVAAKCEEEGKKVEVCKVCGFRKETKVSALGHKWVADESKPDTPATCEAPGKKFQKCSTCGKTQSVDTDMLEHEWEKVKDNNKETGYSQTSQYKCKYGDHYALRWTALDLVDSVDIEKNTSGDNAGSVRLKTAQYDGQDKSKVGSKLIYKIKSGAAVQKVSFAFNAVLKYGQGAPAPLFDYVSGDQQQGYIENENGELVLTTKRYQLKVNDKVIEIGKDNKYGDEITGVAGEPHWYDWPVSFDLAQGDNTIEIMCLGGYRAYLFDFQVMGLPANA